MPTSGNAHGLNIGGYMVGNGTINVSSLTGCSVSNTMKVPHLLYRGNDDIFAFVAYLLGCKNTYTSPFLAGEYENRKKLHREDLVVREDLRMKKMDKLFKLCVLLGISSLIILQILQMIHG